MTRSSNAVLAIAVAGVLLMISPPRGRLALAPRLAAQFGQPVVVIQPAAAVLSPGGSQTFQLLDMNGRDVRSDTWSVSDPTIAELAVADGRATLTGRRDGRVTLTSGRARSDTITVRSGQGDASEAAWVLRSLDGRFSKVLAAGTVADAADGQAAYYYEDRGRGSTHVRAVARDGVMLWQWPPPMHGGTPALLAADRDGVLLRVTTRDQRELVSLDRLGAERWRVPAPGLPPGGVAVAPTGLVLFVTDTGAARRLVAVDGRTGALLSAVLLDAGQTEHRGFTIQGGGLTCAPGAQRASGLPLRATPVVMNARGVASLLYAEWSMVADATGCAAGSRLALSDIRVRGQQRLVLLEAGPHLPERATDALPVTRHILEDHQVVASGEERAAAVSAPMPELIVGPDGLGFVVPIRRTTRDWLTGDETLVGDVVSRFQGGQRTPMYVAPLPATADPAAIALLVGDSYRAVYAARGQSVLALEAGSGKERWRWKAPVPRADLVAPAGGDAVIVRAGEHYLTVAGGQVTREVDETTLLFAWKNLTERQH